MTRRVCKHRVCLNSVSKIADADKCAIHKNSACASGKPSRCTVPCLNFQTCGNLRMPQNKTGLCSHCWSKGQFGGVVKALFADPEYRAAQSARASKKMKAVYENNPDYRASVKERLAKARAQPGFREKATAGVRAGHERRTREAIAGFTPEQVETFWIFHGRGYSKKAARDAVLGGLSPDAPKPPRKATSSKQSTPDLTEAAILFGKRDQYNRTWTVDRLAERYGVTPEAVEKAVARPST